MTKLPEIASLWIGSELTWLEQVCLKSYIDHGHKVYLYSYDPVENVPDGVVMKDAAEILPADKIIRHARTGSPAFHADVFRLRLMKKTPISGSIPMPIAISPSNCRAMAIRMALPMWASGRRPIMAYCDCRNPPRR